LQASQADRPQDASMITEQGLQNGMTTLFET
jgi:hypothetical protein